MPNAFSFLPRGYVDVEQGALPETLIGINFCNLSSCLDLCAKAQEVLRCVRHDLTMENHILCEKVTSRT